MKKINDESKNWNNNEEDFTTIIEDNNENNEINQALLDVIADPNPYQEQDNKQNDVNPNIAPELSSELFIKD